MVQGSPSRPVLRLAIPAVINNLSLTLMQTADMAFVGALGPEAIGAVGTMGTLIWAVMTPIDGLATGITSCVARRVGAQDLKGARLFGRSALAASLALGLLLWPLLEAGQNWLFRAIALPEALWGHASGYWGAFLPFLPLAYLRTALDSVHRAGGAAFSPTVVTLLANALNVGLDPVLIFGLGPLPPLGTAGAALATGLSVCAALVIQATMLAGRSWSPFLGRGLSRQALVPMVQIGLPAALEQGAMAVSQNLIVAWAVNPLGPLPAASFQITMRLAGLSFTPAFGFGMAAIVLVGQALGAGSPALARRLGWTTTAWAVGILTALGLVYWFAAAPLASLFTADTAVINLSIWPLRVYALTMGFLGATMVLAPALRGAGDTRYTLTTMVLSRFGVRLPLAWALGMGLGWGLIGVWIGMGSDFVVRALVLGVRFAGSRWESAARI